MSKKNKGGSRSARRAISSEKKGLKEKERQRMKMRMKEVLIFLHDLSLEDCHQILFSCLRSVEVSMEEQGKTVPKYVEHRVSRVKQDMNPDYTPCRKCEFAIDKQQDSMGVYCRCSVFSMADGSDLLVGRDDGCSRGLIRKEYVK